METKYEEIYALFLNRIINDDTFFNKNVSVDESKTMSEKHMKSLLSQSVYKIVKCTNLDCEVDLITNMDDANNTFIIELTLLEKQLIADLMFESYVDEQTIKMFKALSKLGFSDSEIKRWSPAESLTSFRKSFELLQGKNEQSIYNYKKRGRSDYKVKKFNYSSIVG